jgi:hypothetical protein
VFKILIRQSGGAPPHPQARGSASAGHCHVHGGMGANPMASGGENSRHGSTGRRKSVYKSGDWCRSSWVLRRGKLSGGRASLPRTRGRRLGMQGSSILTVLLPLIEPGTASFGVQSGGCWYGHGWVFLFGKAKWIGTGLPGRWWQCIFTPYDVWRKAAVTPQGIRTRT